MRTLLVFMFLAAAAMLMCRADSFQSTTLNITQSYAITTPIPLTVLCPSGEHVFQCTGSTTPLAGVRIRPSAPTIYSSADNCTAVFMGNSRFAYTPGSCASIVVGATCKTTE
jgi:hypothetical protein